MKRLVVQRLGFLVLVVLGVSVLTFTISHLIPGDPAQLVAGPRATAAQIAEVRTQMGLDQPVLVQYLHYIGNLLHGDLGTSIQTGRPVTQDLLRRFPATIELMSCAMLLTILAGIPMGVFAALYKDRWPDNLIRGISVLNISMPSFWIGLMLILIFYDQLGWLPGVGRLSAVLDPPPSYTGFYTLDALIAGDWRVFQDAAAHLVLPALTISLVSIGGIVRMVRSTMLEVLNEDYIKMARASGIAERTVLFNLALRNAMIPVVTVLGLSIAEMLSGAVVVETIFAWPGSGSYMVASIMNLDFPVIMGFTLIVSMAYVIINLLVDLLYQKLDPQIKASTK